MSIKPIDMHMTLATSVKEAKIKQSDLNRPKVLSSQIQNQQEVVIKKNLSKVRSAEAKEHARISKDKITKEQQNAKKRRKKNKQDSETSKKQDNSRKNRIVDESEQVGSKLDIRI
ncbi:MAG: hypothetical protein LR001_01330 [Clostridiales bacterium]|nr:hypothetical protein [Clostridiales bacterium]